MGVAAQAAVENAPDREFDMSARDFDRVRRLIRERAGISLSAGKRNMVYSRLSRRLRVLGLQSFTDYLDRLESAQAANSPEQVEFVNALTTNLTAFWREAHHFPILADYLKRRSAQGGSPLRLWCCAASTGEEPYTIAITALQAGVTARLLATDIDTQVLETARRAVYSAERVAEVDGGILRRFFLKNSRGEVKLKNEVTSLVEFQQLNLLDKRWALQGPYSVIFCRNVMIYFDKPTQYEVLGRLAALLEPGGLLFAGHSENFTAAKDLLRPLGRTVYERMPAA
jgi:chemotaxis protein methyltransferase CheR